MAHVHLTDKEIAELLDNPMKAANFEKQEKCRICMAAYRRIASDRLTSRDDNDAIEPYRRLANAIVDEMRTCVVNARLGRWEYKPCAKKWVGSSFQDDLDGIVPPPGDLRSRVVQELLCSVTKEQLRRIDVAAMRDHVAKYVAVFLQGTDIRYTDTDSLVALARTAVSDSHPGMVPWTLRLGIGPSVTRISARLPLYFEPVVRIIKNFSANLQKGKELPEVRLVTAAGLAPLNGANRVVALQWGLAHLFLAHQYFSHFFPGIFESARIVYDYYEAGPEQREVVNSLRLILQDMQDERYGAAVQSIEQVGAQHSEEYSLNHLVIFGDLEPGTGLQVSLGGYPERIFNAFRRTVCHLLRDRGGRLFGGLRDGVMLTMGSFRKPVYMPEPLDVKLEHIAGGRRIQDLLDEKAALAQDPQRKKILKDIRSDLSFWLGDLGGSLASDYERLISSWQDRFLPKRDPSDLVFSELPDEFRIRCSEALRDNLDLKGAAIPLKKAVAERKSHFAAIESKWQAYWDENDIFSTKNPGEPKFDASRPKFYVLDMFPYPSRFDLNVIRRCTATDTFARYKRMRGYNVLHPVGWDAFGSPEEEYAVRTDQPPEDAVRYLINDLHENFESMGFSYGWDREFSTRDREYYRWTQWIFLKLWDSWYDRDAKRARSIDELPIPADIAADSKRRREFMDSKRLAYQDEARVWWCEQLGTVANEDVKDHKTVGQGYDCREIFCRQWFLRISEYADRLNTGLDGLDWPTSVKEKQRNAIRRIAAGNDWLFSRQRFWGEPLPILYELDDAGCLTGRLREVDPNDLPVDLPMLNGPTPRDGCEPPLEKAPREWLYRVIGGKRYKLETNTMPQWAGSCWYYLRFIDPTNKQAFVDPAKERTWMPVDLYVGSAEYAETHLLYSRFWHQVLFDLGLVSTPEPFQRLCNPGDIVCNAFVRANGQRVAGDQAVRHVFENEDDRRAYWHNYSTKFSRRNKRADGADDEAYVHRVTGEPLMVVDEGEVSISDRNLFNPKDVIAAYGADALRLCVMHMAPLDVATRWEGSQIEEMSRFLRDAFDEIVGPDGALRATLKEDVGGDVELERSLARTIQRVTQQLEKLCLDTAIQPMIEFLAIAKKGGKRKLSRRQAQQFVLLLAPFAPHVAEELWEYLGGKKPLADEPWPQYDEAEIVEESIEVVVQVNGKACARTRVPTGSSSEQLEAAARANERVALSLVGKEVLRVVVVPGRLVNFVLQQPAKIAS